MSAFPAGYQRVQGLRRKGVSVLCILLASAMAMGILVYVDSYSIHEWDRQMQSVGSVGMVVQSYENINVGNYLPDIKALPEVTKAAAFEYTYSWMSTIPSGPNARVDSGNIMRYSEEYMTAFPNRFNLTAGMFPVNNRSIALLTTTAKNLGVTIGDDVNYTVGSTLYTNEWVYAVLEVVGIYELEPNYQSAMYGYGYYSGPIAIVVPQLINQRDITTEVHLDIDRSQLSPFNVQATLTYLNNIHEEIRSLDPSYNPQYYYSRIYVSDYLNSAVNAYSGWLMSTRITEIGRAVGPLLLVVLAMFLAIRYNMNDRRYENNMLMSRGASQGDIEKRVMHEVVGLSVVGTVVGLGVGILFSRIGLAATGYFQFDFVLIFTEPFLISIESAIMAVAIGMLLPIMTWVGYNMLYSTKRKADESTGKLEKTVKFLTFIRWDVILFILSAAFLVGLLSTGQLLTYIPLFSFIASLIPLAMFISLGSLTIKGLRSGANRISHGMNHVVGLLPSSIGVRRVGKSASSAGPAILVLVLSVSIGWTYAVIGASMPITKENQAKFAFGGDVAFHLGSYPTPQWSAFVANVSEHPSCAASSMIYTRQVFLSAEQWDQAYLVGMDAEEYKYVGYDQWGTPLNTSSINPMMSTLANTPSGAIVTEDIAATYDLKVGDIVRVFSDIWSSSQEIYVFTIVGIAHVLANSVLTDTGTTAYGYGYSSYYNYYYQEVGSDSIWVNREYLGTLMSLTNDTDNILCVRTYQGANGTKLVEDVLNEGGSQVVSSNGWAAATHEVDSYSTAAQYRIDRATDTLLTVSSSAVIFAAFIIYAFEGVDGRKREIALIRSMGGERKVVLKAQMAEMTVLILVGIAFLCFYGPLSIMDSLIGYRSSFYMFPVTVFPVFPMTTMLMIVLFFIGSAIIFVLLVAGLGSRVNIAESLNANWAESGPYGGDV